MALRRKPSSSRARGKRPFETKTKTEHAHAREERQKAQADMSLFGSLAEHERYCSDFRQKKVIAGRDVNFSLEGSRLETLFSKLGWLPLVSLHEPVYPTLV